MKTNEKQLSFFQTMASELGKRSAPEAASGSAENPMEVDEVSTNDKVDPPPPEKDAVPGAPSSPKKFKRVHTRYCVRLGGELYATTASLKPDEKKANRAAFVEFLSKVSSAKQFSEWFIQKLLEARDEGILHESVYYALLSPFVDTSFGVQDRERPRRTTVALRQLIKSPLDRVFCMYPLPMMQLFAAQRRPKYSVDRTLMPLLTSEGFYEGIVTVQTYVAKNCIDWVEQTVFALQCPVTSYSKSICEEYWATVFIGIAAGIQSADGQHGAFLQRLRIAMATKPKMSAAAAFLLHFLSNPILLTLRHLCSMLNDTYHVLLHCMESAVIQCFSVTSECLPNLLDLNRGDYQDEFPFIDRSGERLAAVLRKWPMLQRDVPAPASAAPVAASSNAHSPPAAASRGPIRFASAAGSSADRMVAYIPAGASSVAPRLMPYVISGASSAARPAQRAAAVAPEVAFPSYMPVAPFLEFILKSPSSSPTSRIRSAASFLRSVNGYAHNSAVKALDEMELRPASWVQPVDICILKAIIQLPPLCTKAEFERRMQAYTIVDSLKQAYIKFYEEFLNEQSPSGPS